MGGEQKKLYYIYLVYIVQKNNLLPTVSSLLKKNYKDHKIDDLREIGVSGREPCRE